MSLAEQPDSKKELTMSDPSYHMAGKLAIEHDQLSADDTLEGLGLNGSLGETVELFDGKARLQAGAVLQGLWHYSEGRIERFSEDSVTDHGGKFGKGTYFGAGELVGETVDDLKSKGAIRHEVNFAGNVLALARDDVVEVAARLREANGEAPTKLKSSIPNADLTALLGGMDFDGRKPDAVLVTMSEGRAAELVVLPHALGNISIVNS